jgi:hypothetical protein
MNSHKDQQNEIPGTYPSPDVENGGQIPNDSIGWDPVAFDRMEGSIKGKNKPQNQNNTPSVNQNYDKKVY